MAEKYNKGFNPLFVQVVMMIMNIIIIHPVPAQCISKPLTPTILITTSHNYTYSFDDNGTASKRTNEHNILVSHKTAFCLGEKLGILVNNECSSWYNRVDDF